MTVTPKYKAKFVFYDLERRIVVRKEDVLVRRGKKSLVLPDNVIRFDSQHEFKVYLELCRMYGASYVCRQRAVKIYSPGLCYPKGKNWKVDFGVISSAQHNVLNYLVEAKGAFLPEFAHTLASFEEAQAAEAFKKLFIVFSEIPTHNRVIKALLNSPYQHNLLTLEKLKCLQHLPLPL